MRQWYETAVAEGDARTQTHREVLDQNTGYARRL